MVDKDEHYRRLRARFQALNEEQILRAEAQLRARLERYLREWPGEQLRGALSRLFGPEGPLLQRALRRLEQLAVEQQARAQSELAALSQQLGAVEGELERRVEQAQRLFAQVGGTLTHRSPLNFSSLAGAPQRFLERARERALLDPRR